MALKAVDTNVSKGALRSATAVARERERFKQRKEIVQTRAAGNIATEKAKASGRVHVQSHHASAKIREKRGEYAARLEYQQQRASQKQNETLGAKPLVMASSIAAHQRDVAGQEAAAQQRRKAEQARIAQRNAVITGAGASVAGAAIKSPAGRSATSTIMLVVFTFFGLIAVYLLVTKSSQTSGFLGSLSTWVTKLSSTQPLFTKTATSTSSSGG